MKMKALRKTTTVVSMLLFGIFTTGTIIANENASQVSSALGAKTFEIVTDESAANEDTEYYKSDFTKVGDLIKAGRDKAADVVAEGVVLLKNDKQALPLTKGAKVSLFGTTSYDPVYGGTGSGGISSADAVNFVSSYENAGLELNPTLKENYTNTDIWGKNSGYMRKAQGWGSNVVRKINDVPWDVVESAAKNSFAAYGDAAIFTCGRIGGEGSDLTGHGNDGIDKGDGIGNDYLGLTETELSVLKGLKAQKDAGVFKKIIVIVNYASMIEGDFINDPQYGVDAALWIGTPGMGGSALGKVITGEISPSGRLSDTMWMDNALNPVNVNFGYWVYDGAKELGVPTEPGNMWVPEPTLSCYVVYQEGMYLGYKYTETRYEDYVMGTANAGNYSYNDVVAYPFGHGLNYTDFEYSNFSVKKSGDRTYDVSVTVKNVGTTYASKHSVEVYLSKPYGDYAKKNKVQVPSVELIDFGKTKTLKPGESETVSITLDEKFFASYDAYGVKGYVLMDGDYYVTVADGSHDAVNNVLAAKGYTPSNTSGKMDDAGDASLVKKFTLSFDDDKYAYSDSVSSLDGVTRNQVSNLFDFGDINLYSGKGDNHVDYYSRDNWNAVSLDITNGHPTLKMTQQMAMEIYAQTPEGIEKPIPSQYSQPLQKDDIPYPTYGKDSGIMLINMLKDDNGKEIDFFSPVWDTFLDQLTYEETAKLCLMGYHLTAAVDTITKPETNDENGPNGFNQAYQKSNMGLFFRTEKAAGHVNEDGTYTDAVDPDGAKKTTGFPANGLLSATRNKDLAYEVGNIIGNDGIWSGHSGLYGIGANIHRSPYLGRCAEYYSEDGTLTGLIAAYECKGIEEKGVHVYNKHCVVNDQEACRHGVGVWLPEQALREIYLRAFELPITMGGAYNTMSSFARIGTQSGCACPALAEDFLRGECGMKGIIVTDCYTDMDGSQGADPYFEMFYGIAIGGSDIPDGNGPWEDKQHEIYKTGYGAVAQRMRLVAKRVLWQTVHSNAMNGFSSSTRIVSITPWWQILLTTLDVVFALAFVASLGWTVVALVKEEKERK